MIFQMQKNNSEESHTKSHSDFSIDHILKRAGCNSNSGQVADEKPDEASADGPFKWLNCTRFCPPRIPRSQKREGPQKRQLGRYPRIPFTSYQIAVLEEKFQQCPYLSSEEATQLSSKLQLTEVKVKIWFQNRRARKRREEIGLSKQKEEKTERRNDDVVFLNSVSDTEGSSSDKQNNPVALPFIYIPTENILNFKR